MKTQKMLNAATAGLLALTTLLLASQSFAQGASNFTPEWVERSNDIAYKLLESRAKFAPEVAGQMEVDGLPEQQRRTSLSAVKPFN